MAYRKKAFKTKDEVPELQRDDALELADGSFVVIEADDSGDSGAHKALKAERKLREEAEAAARTARAEAADAVKKLEAFEASGKQTDEKVTALLAKWNKDKDDAVASAIAPLNERINALSGDLSKFQLDDRLVSAFRKSGGVEARSNRALVLAKQDGWQLIDGKVVRKNADGEVMTQNPDEYFVGELKKDLPDFFAGTQADGGGGAGGRMQGGAGAGAPAAGTPTKWTADQRAAFIETNGVQAFNELLDAQLAAGLTASKKP
jgi:hypothetical protein